MSLSHNMYDWSKVENEAGYPNYVWKTTGHIQLDHPQFKTIINSVFECDYKYSVYRIAFKLFNLQKEFKVPPLHISSGVFARHQLSLSETSLSLDPVELEAVLADIYFAAKKEGCFSDDVDLFVDLIMNLILNIYDGERKEPVRVLAAKTLLIILSCDSYTNKWQALSNCASDHNGCVSPKRLSTLLTHVQAVVNYLGEQDDFIQTDVGNCFVENAGMLGMSSSSIAQWAESSCLTTRWLEVLDRIQESRKHLNTAGNCSTCGNSLQQMLRFRCSKCTNVYLCEKCYLNENNDQFKISRHKKSHTVLEILDDEPKRESSSIINGMRRLLFCTKRKKTKYIKKNQTTENQSVNRRRNKPSMFTSTVGRASGAHNPFNMLQDIISQLESQNAALNDVCDQYKDNTHTTDSELKAKVDLHRDQISTQINRLKALKEHLLVASQNLLVEAKQSKDKDRMQAFDLFSPILVDDEKQSKITDSAKVKPRVLSLDSGHISMSSKADKENIMTMSGDAFQPVVINVTTDSISTVSMNDISNWYNETAPQSPDNTCTVQPRLAQGIAESASHSLSATEMKYDADLRSVASVNDKVKELNADLDTVLDRLQQILNNNFAMDDSNVDNTLLRDTANEMESLLGTLVRGIEQRTTINNKKALV